MKSDDQSPVETVDAPWNEAIVFVCTKCSRKICGSEQMAEELKSKLKSTARDQGWGKSVRVVTSSCLDICPDRLMAVSAARTGLKPVFRSVVVSPKIDPSELLVRLLEKKAPG